MDMPVFSQSTRRAQVTTPFGGETLLLGRLAASEQVSRPFQLDLTMLSEKGDLNPDTVLGKPMTVTMTMKEGAPKRHFHGLVTQFAQSGYNERLHEYRATVRPWFWFLTRTADCRVFQGRTVPQIFQDVCKQAGFADFRLALSGTYDPWEYCVQYRESDFNFLSRLLEQEGIFYFFEHESSKHVLVLSDDPAQLTTTSGYESVPYFPPAGNMTQRERDHLSHWAFQKSFQPATFATRDYDFKTPSPVLAGTSSISRQHDAAKYEIFDYPAEPATQSSAAVERVAKIRVQELQTAQMLAHGSGDAAGLATGRLFKVTGHPRADLNIQYFIVGTQLQLTNDNFQTGGEGGEGSGAQFKVSIEAVDVREPYRPARITPKPLVQGSQTAVVVGPKGEEIYTDEFSRVKVQFHWDRYGKLDENSSCWMRVAQPWAGKNWGSIRIPRIGQEVVVSFLEGDPDQPLIIGSVYNGANKPPYGLPDNKTQSGVKSRSSLQGTGENFNEIRFEDKKGEEQLYIHAEKNQDIMVEKDETHTVGNDRTKDIKHDETSTIGNDRKKEVKHDETVVIGNDRKKDVKHDDALTVGNDRTKKVQNDETTSIGKDRTETVGSNERVTVSKDQTVKIGSNHELNVGKDRNIDVGASQRMTIGRNLLIDAGDQVTIRTGNASITMRSDGTIAIRGSNITIQGSGGINVRASNDVVIKGSKVLSN